MPQLCSQMFAPYTVTYPTLKPRPLRAVDTGECESSRKANPS